MSDPSSPSTILNLKQLGRQRGCISDICVAEPAAQELDEFVGLEKRTGDIGAGD